MFKENILYYLNWYIIIDVFDVMLIVNVLIVKFLYFMWINKYWFVNINFFIN